MISTLTLQQLWKVVTATQTGMLLQLNDVELSDQLLRQLSRQHPVSGEEGLALREYVRIKLPLIRDLAEARLYVF